MKPSRFLPLPTAAAMAAFSFTAAFAAPIQYGNFSGTSVMYIDVTETANSLGDDEPLYGPPSIAGNQLRILDSTSRAGG